MEEQNDEFFEALDFSVDAKQSPIRIDKFLQDKTAKLSRNRIQNAIRAGSVTVNGKSVKPNHKVKPHQQIRMVLVKQFDDDGTLKAEDIPLDIRYEDEDLLIVYKPPGMVVHPGVGHRSGTLVNALAGYLKTPDIPILPGNQPDRVGLVHRIDKDTSGLLVIAKTDYAMTHLAKQFFDHTIDRTYMAIVWGEPDPPEGTINRNIMRDYRNRTNYVVTDEPDEGKVAITHYRSVEPLYYATLVELKLETGRTHQIRVHMKSLGHPLFSDKKYGGDRIIKGTVYSKYKSFVEKNFALCPRQALHAKSLAFTHPTTGERMFFDSPLPDDMAAIMERWRNYLSSRKNL
ncbi:MAG: RluA family pseudouridine synthase [Bacteroidota bacterium]